MSSSQRSLPRSLVALALVLLAVRIAAETWHRVAPASEPDHPIAWMSYEDAVAEADGRRPVLIEFTADWCAPCRTLDEVTLRDPDFAAYVNARFRPVRMTNSGDASVATPGEAGLRARFEVESFPTLLVEIPGGEPEILAGARSTVETRRFLEAARLRALVMDRRTREPR